MKKLMLIVLLVPCLMASGSALRTPDDVIEAYRTAHIKAYSEYRERVQALRRVAAKRLEVMSNRYNHDPERKKSILDKANELGLEQTKELSGTYYAHFVGGDTHEYIISGNYILYQRWISNNKKTIRVKNVKGTIKKVSDNEYFVKIGDEITERWYIVNSKIFIEYFLENSSNDRPYAAAIISLKESK